MRKEIENIIKKKIGEIVFNDNLSLNQKIEEMKKILPKHLNSNQFKYVIQEIIEKRNVFIDIKYSPLIMEIIETTVDFYIKKTSEEIVEKYSIQTIPLILKKQSDLDFTPPSPIPLYIFIIFCVGIMVVGGFIFLQ